MPKQYIAAIDLGGTNLKIALLDLKYKIRDKNIVSTPSFFKKDNLIRGIIDSINRLIKNSGLNNKDVLGLGLGLPGPVDNQRGIIHFFPNIPGWQEVNLKAVLEKKLRLPVFLDNDANLMALAEYKLGRAKGTNHAICLTLGTGVGGGIIINGKLFRGAHNATGEIGHIPINENGPVCNCGGIACLETYIGNNRILKDAKRLFKRNVSLEELSGLAKKKNQKALKIWAQVAKRLGVALTGIVNLLNPDCIVIGGGVSNAGRILFDKVRQEISERAMPVQARHVKILKAKLGDNAGLIGAAILVKETVTQNDN